MPNLIFLFLIAVSAHALEPFLEQKPLPMMAPNINKEQPEKWIPLSSDSKEAVIKNTSMSATNINKLIKTQIQKKMQILLNPLTDDQDEH